MVDFTHSTNDITYDFLCVIPTKPHLPHLFFYFHNNLNLDAEHLLSTRDCGKS